MTVGALQSKMYFALGIADVAYADEGLECVITAGTDGDHNPGSKHDIGLAVDIRNSQCTQDQRIRILSKLKRLERYGFDVVDEGAGATAKTTAQHYHVEFDPKPGEEFWRIEGA